MIKAERTRRERCVRTARSMSHGVPKHPTLWYVCHSSVFIVVYMQRTLSLYILQSCLCLCHACLLSISKSPQQLYRPRGRILDERTPAERPIRRHLSVTHRRRDPCKTHIEAKRRINQHLPAAFQERIHCLELRRTSFEHHTHIIAPLLLRGVQLIRDRSTHGVPASFCHSGQSGFDSLGKRL